jgi:hypothetical protein
MKAVLGYGISLAAVLRMRPGPVEQADLQLNPSASMRRWIAFGVWPVPAATSKRDNDRDPDARATLLIITSVVVKPPKQRLTKRRSENAAAISEGEPESVSSNSGICCRFMSQT